MERIKALIYDKLHMPQKRQLLILLPFALFYCGAAILGQLEKARTLGVWQNLCRILLWFVGSYVVLLILCGIISGRKERTRERREGRWYLYFLFAFVCLLCYMPYFLMYFPGWLNNDAVWQIEQILGWAPGSNHHPYYHTLLMKCFFMAGYHLFGTYTAGAAFYTFCQMAVMAFTFAFFLYWLYRRGTRLPWLLLAFVFYAALPVNGMQAICMGKDAFFTAALLVFAWMTVEFDLDAHASIDGDGEQDTGQDTAPRKKMGRIGARKRAAWFMAALLVCLLRSNGIFIFLGTALVLILVKVRRGRFPVRTAACAAAVLACYLVCHGPVLRALQVQQPDTIESLTMPVQHILCAYLKGGHLTEEEIAMIDRVAPADQIGEYYNPWFFDIVKNFIREQGDQQVIADHKWDYFRLWLRVGLRNPFQYLVAQVRQTSGYWAMGIRDYQYLYSEYYMVDNPFGITTQRQLFTYDNELAMRDFLMGFQDLYNKVWSLGMNTWLMVFGIAYVAYRRKSAMIYVPFVMLLATLLLATPVYNEFRYAYGVFAAFPLLFACSFGGEER